MSRPQPTEQDQIAEGNRAFWRANQRDAAHGMWWLMGWDAAAVEAALLLQGEGHLIKSGKAVREALMESPAALRSLIDMKTPFGLRRKAEAAIESCEAALKLISEGPANAKPAPSAVAKSGSAAVAGQSKESTRSGSRR